MQRVARGADVRALERWSVGQTPAAPEQAIEARVLVRLADACGAQVCAALQAQQARALAVALLGAARALEDEQQQREPGGQCRQ